MTPAQALEVVALLMTQGRADLAEAVMASVMQAAAAPSPSTHEAELSGNAARCRRYRERKAMSGDTPTMSDDMPASMSQGMSAPMSVPMSQHVAQTEIGMSLAHVATMSLPMSQEGERGRGDYRGVVGEGEIRVLADSGSTGSMLPMVPTGPNGHMLTRPAAVEAVKGKLVHMADARERRESKHKAEAELVFRYWQAKLGHTKAMFSRDREAKLVARLREGSTPDELCYAVDGIAKSPWHMGENPGAQRYDGIELLFRNRANVEKFASSQRGFRDGKPHPFVAEATEAVQMAVQQTAGDTIVVSGGVAYA